MRDDFDVPVYPVRVALTWDQVKDLNLPESPDCKAKRGNTNYKSLFNGTGLDSVWELQVLQSAAATEIIG